MCTTFEGAAAWADVRAAFDAHRLVLVRTGLATNAPEWPAALALLQADAAATFCVERGQTGLAPKSTLGGGPASWRRGDPWYVSFILRGERLCDGLLKKLPRAGAFDADAVPGVVGAAVRHGDHAWVFASSSTKKNLPGRAEHTDSLAPEVAGTWHVQVSGSKVWRVRPEDRDAEATEIVCGPGDLLLIDTRAWRHQTSIRASKQPSISVARDFCYGEPPEQLVTNVDATLAARAMRKGDVVLTEDDLPDCALPRCETPNCEVAESRGKMALVALRAIRAGEPLTVAPSDDEDDDDDDDDDGDDDDDDEEEEEPAPPAGKKRRV
ncbi:hypothetical protein M885DRAFT_538326 [Pelagophyceae sp. CCMP2097]|nr:hypothetical protein M885DRAFT_538326 [Pelagophyceae sp. CCMP2097]